MAEQQEIGNLLFVVVKPGCNEETSNGPFSLLVHAGWCPSSVECERVCVCMCVFPGDFHGSASFLCYNQATHAIFHAAADVNVTKWCPLVSG